MNRYITFVFVNDLLYKIKILCGDVRTKEC